MSRRRGKAGLPAVMDRHIDLIAARVADRIIAKSAQTPVPLLSDPFFNMTERTARMRASETLTRPFEQHAWISAGMRQIAQNFVRAELKFSRGTKEKHDRKIKSSEPCAAVWDKPNPFMSYGYFFEAVITHIWDIGYVGLIKGTRGGQRLGRKGDIPEELWPVRGTHLEPVFDIPGQPPTGWKLRNEAGEITFEPWEILWVKTFNPYEPWKGLGRIQAAMAAAQQDFKSEQFMTGFIENDATPGGVFSTDFHTTPEQREQVSDDFEAKHVGPSNVNRVLVLQKGMTFTPTTYSPRDMQYQELQHWNMKKTCGVMGVPRVLLGDTEDANRASSTETMKSFLRNTLMPAGAFIATAITMDMQALWIGCADVWAEFDWSTCPELQEIGTDQIDTAAKTHAMGVPFDEINERMSLGYKPLPEGTGKVGFLPSGLVLATIAAEGGMVPAPAAPAPTGDQPNPNDPQAGSDGPAAAGDAGGKDPNADKPKPKEPPPAGKESTGLEIRKALGLERASILPKWHLYVAQVLDPVEAALASKVRRFFWDLRRHMLDLVDDAFLKIQNPQRAFVAREEDKTKRRLSRSLIDRLLFNAKEWGRKLWDIIRPAHKEAAKASLEFIKDELPRGTTVVLDTGDSRIKRFLEGQEIKVRGITDDLRERIRKVLVDSVIEANTIAEAQREIAKIMRHQVGNALSRSLMIARTETAGAANGARSMELEEQAAKPGSKLSRRMWLNSDDLHVRLLHQNQPIGVGGEIVPIGQPYSNGLMYPAEVSAPPEQRIGCRCIELPLFDK